MNSLLLTGTIIIQLALVSYSIAVITEQRKQIISKNVLSFFTFAVFFNISANIFMIAGSRNSAFTVHGLIGYSALLGMMIELILIWKLKAKSGLNATVSTPLHLYIRISYLWWLIAYVTSAIVASARI
ncbi:MAG: hypothetical protein WCT77_06915 [Bacteroidota bacterium]